MSYDTWKTTEPPEQPSSAVRYRCVDCAWRGREAFEHHRLDHHRILLANGLEAIFSCCDHEATGMPLVHRQDVA